MTKNHYYVVIWEGEDEYYYTYSDAETRVNELIKQGYNAKFEKITEWTV